MTFPLFRYHPDPIASGSVAESETQCLCCEQKRGFIYTGPVHAEDTLEKKICPWCIADGQAAEKFEAVFTDKAGIGADELAVETQEKVARRTPGFASWQQERWLSCCNDAAAFLGPMGYEELKKFGPEAAAAVKEHCGLEGDEWLNFLRSLKRDEAPTAFVFQCLHCSAIRAYTDCV
jgi:uncharacterized protein